MEIEDQEQDLIFDQEAINTFISVKSVNGKTGTVVLTTSDLENTSDYQTGTEVENAISTAIAGKQDILTAGDGIDITNNVISNTRDTIEWGKITGDISYQTDLQDEFSAITNDISDIKEVIPNSASSSNQLADKDFVTDSISSSSANFIGTFNSVTDLEDYSGPLTNNDYAFVISTDSAGNTIYNRYKYNGSEWLFEYAINNSSFTSAQWDAINSGITTSRVSQIGTNENDIGNLQTNKQNIIDNSLDTTSKTIPGAINEVNSIALGANQALSFTNYSSLVTDLNSASKTEYNVGQNIYVLTLNVPDLWVSSVEATSVPYSYVDDEVFVNALEQDGYIRIGYYKVSALETQEVDLTNYVKNTDYADSGTAGVVKISSNRGMSISNTGLAYIYKASNADILAKTQEYRPIVPNNLDYAIEQGLGNNSLTWTTTEQTNARNTINAVGKSDVATGRYDQGNGGIVGIGAGNGIGISSGNLYIDKADNSQIDAETNNFRPLVSSNYRRAVNRVINDRFVTLTQAEYDALVSGGTVDANTYYMIKE